MLTKDKKSSFSGKQIERAAYLFLLISLLAGRAVATFFTWFSFLVPKWGKQRDFLFFPYAHKDNSGAVARFQIYLPYLEKDGYTYHIDYICSEDYYNRIYYKEKNRAREYLFYQRLFWRRLFKVLGGRNYRAVFIRRSMFPNYYNQSFPYLERLLSKLNDNITIDYFDADYALNKPLIERTVSYCNKVSVVNEYLYNYFSNLHPKIYYNNLAIDTQPYLPKENFQLHHPVTIFWTGGAGNTVNLKDIIPILEKINKDNPLKLLIVGKSNGGYNQPFVEQREWNFKTFFDYLNKSDIAIYPAFEDDEFHRGKLAYKTLDYAAAKLPMVASPLGLSPYFKNETDVLVATTEEEWEAGLRRLIGDENLRKQLAENTHAKLMEYHYVTSVYKNFLKILLD